MNETPHHIIGFGTLSATPRDYTIVSTAAERGALAASFRLPAIGALEGRFSLTLQPGGVVAAGLRMLARVTQDCVVTLEPFESVLDETVTLRFVPAAALAEESEAADDPDAPDEIPYEGSTIDLGAALAEQLALSLDPYPRKPDAVFTGAERDAEAHPFAALAKFKANDDQP